MLFRRETLSGIRAGAITVAFRRWRRPTVRAGGSLRTAAGELTIRSVDPVQIDGISEADARRAGYDSRAALLAELDRRDAGVVYRIELGALRRDSREALREQPAAGADWQELTRRLARLDARAPNGPWTARVLELIDRHPGLRAAELCDSMGQQMMPFKLNVRKLKNLGLTISLETGYTLSERGKAVLQTLRQTRARNTDAPPD
jgi:hypothetical protein